MTTASGVLLVRRAISRPLFGVVALSFLLPFVSASCAGIKLVTITGTNLVFGGDVSSPDPFGGSAQTTEVEREPWAIVAGAAAALGLLVGTGGAAVLFGAGGVGALLMLRWSLLREVADGAAMGFALDFEWGYWVALAGFAAAAATGVGVQGSSVAPKPARRPLARQEGIRPCPFCRETIPIDSAFCERCGENVGAIPPGVWE